MNYKKIYAIYNNNGDLPVCVGNAFECAEFLNIKVNSFYSLFVKHKKIDKGKYKIYEIDNDSIDDNL